jgi:hypothetical protein
MMEILCEEFRLLVECFSYTDRRAQVAFERPARKKPLHRDLGAVFALRFVFLFLTSLWRKSIIALCVSKGP